MREIFEWWAVALNLGSMMYMLWMARRMGKAVEEANETTFHYMKKIHELENPNYWPVEKKSAEELIKIYPKK